MRQSQALDILKAGRNVYLTGAAGSGKTHVLNEYINYLKDRGVSVGVTASTGIAATHLGGVTIHSWSGVGIKEYISDDEIDALTQKEYLYKRFDKTKVLIIDEISMLSPRMLDNVERVCCAMKRCKEPFGGMQVVLSGDFFQLPPIVRDGSQVQFVNVSDAWRNMNLRVCYLDEQFRHNDNILDHILNEMRGGRISDMTRSILEEHKIKDFPEGITPTRLYTHNIDVDTLNKKELDNIPGEEHEFEMRTKGRANLVDTLKRGVLAPEVLVLKKGAIVMFVKNNFDAGYVNGTLGVVEEFDSNVPIVKTFSGKKIPVFSMEWVVEENGKILAQVEQLPLRLAWAITIHKSQGMSMDAAEIDLSKAFVPGQGYVALSRLRTLNGLLLRGINDVAFSVHPEVEALDVHLLKESSKWEKVISRFEIDEISAMHKEFIKKSGGTTDEKQIEKNKNKNTDKKNSKKSTYEKTRDLIEEGLDLKEIAEKRGMTVGTIISHFEKLQEQMQDVDLSRFKPKESDFEKIKKAFSSTKGVRISPVHKKLGGKYSYEDIRIARLFI